MLWQAPLNRAIIAIVEKQPYAQKLIYVTKLVYSFVLKLSLFMYVHVHVCVYQGVLYVSEIGLDFFFALEWGPLQVMVND